MSIAIGCIWSIITFVSSGKIILPSLKLLGQTKFYLQLLFFWIKSIFAGNNTKKN